MSGSRKISEEGVEGPVVRQGGLPLGAGAEVKDEVEVPGAGLGVGAEAGAVAEAGQGGRGAIRQNILQLGAPIDAPTPGPGLNREQRAHPETGDVPILRLNPSLDRVHRRRILFYNEAVLSNESLPSIGFIPHSLLTWPSLTILV